MNLCFLLLLLLYTFDEGTKILGMVGKSMHGHTHQTKYSNMSSSVTS